MNLLTRNVELSGLSHLDLSGRLRYLKDHIRANLSGNHKVDRIALAPIQYARINLGFTLAQSISAQDYRRAIKRQLKVIGKQFSQSISDGDSQQVCSMLNEYQWVRDRIENITEIMNDKFSGYFVLCNDCNSLEHEDDCSYAYDEYHVCQSCRDDNYRYSDYRDTYITCDDWHDEQSENDESDDDDEDESIIGSYHSSKGKLSKIPSKFDKRKNPVFLGLELEMEISEDYSRCDKAEQLLDAIGNHRSSIDSRNHAYAFCEGDGSLDRGFEMVTSWTGLDVHREQLQFFKTPFRGARSHDTRTCGLHVHVSKGNMTMLHGAKMILFINDSGNQKLIRDIARRDESNYSKIKNKKASYSWLKNSKQSGSDKRTRLMRLNDDRYEALNFQNPDTIEFRLFKGTLKYDSIMACLEFAYATYQFCRDAGANELTTSNFLEFICKPENLSDTPSLRAYLRSKNYVLPKSGAIKINPRIESSTQLIEA